MQERNTLVVWRALSTDTMRSLTLALGTGSQLRHWLQSVQQRLWGSRRATTAGERRNEAGQRDSRELSTASEPPHHLCSLQWSPNSHLHEGLPQNFLDLYGSGIQHWSAHCWLLSGSHVMLRALCCSLLPQLPFLKAELPLCA